MTIRPATAADLNGITAIYDAILDREEAGPVYTNWQRGKYPTTDTARQALEAGTPSWWRTPTPLPVLWKRVVFVLPSRTPLSLPPKRST